MAVPVIVRRGAELVAAIGLAVAAALAIMLILWEYVFGTHLGTSPPHDPDDASWRYGARHLENQLYLDGSESDDEIAAYCRDALRRLEHRPSGLDEDEAVDGCRYAAWDEGYASD